jgi:Tfp pilus assembly ATPase PilU
MQLLDDHLFKLWEEKKITKENAIAKAQSADDLMQRFFNAERGIVEGDDERAKKAKEAHH